MVKSQSVDDQRLVSQSVRQSVNQSGSQPVRQPVSQAGRQSASQSVSQSVNQSVSQWVLVGLKTRCYFLVYWITILEVSEECGRLSAVVRHSLECGPSLTLRYNHFIKKSHYCTKQPHPSNQNTIPVDLQQGYGAWINRKLAAITTVEPKATFLGV